MFSDSLFAWHYVLLFTLTITDDTESKVSQVGNYARITRRNLGVLDQLGQVFFRNAILRQYVEQDYSNLVEAPNSLVQQYRYNVSHWILYLVPFCVCPHRQILFNFA